MKILKILITVAILVWKAESSNAGLESHKVGPGCGEMSTETNKLTKIPWTANIYLQTETLADLTLPGLIISPTMILMSKRLSYLSFFCTIESDIPNTMIAESYKMLCVWSFGNNDANLLLSNPKYATDSKFRIFPYANYEVRTNITKFGEKISNSRSVQSSKITHIRVHPNFNRKHWTKIENDVAIVHLETPIKFDSQVHPVCLPTIAKMTDILNNWANSSSFAFVSGWNRNEQDGNGLRMRPMSQDYCKSLWENNDETGTAKYINRICANASTENSHTTCIHKDIGTFVENDERFYFVGFINNFFSDNRVCNSKTYFFISYSTPSILEWINKNSRCGPQKFTCNNGDCIPLRNSICNKTSECSDGSDEDPQYCRGLNYCDPDHFACGVYGKCIPKDKLCDGKSDCENKEDEKDCPNAYVTMLLIIAAVGILVITILAIVFWRKMRAAQKKLRNLTDEEVNEFEFGIPSNITLNPESPPAMNFAWDRHRFEISKDKLKIDYSSILGSGAAGIVYNGVYDKGTEIISVAVKTFKSTSDVEDFKALLSELKIMTKVGIHENIVNLVGAYTREIKQRILYMVVELCPLGSLEDYLKTNRHRFIDLYNLKLQGDYVMYGNISNGQSFTTTDLLKWSYQIANGMEHLASINVTHGDLATRNVLITKDFNAKISDFGLSRNLYESGIYTKKHQVPLPWKWMAVESLRDLEFSSQSDAWSYGITLWEIFSLGGVPYPGLNWTAEFLLKLYQGLRMSQPPFANEEIYNLMLKCWHKEPNRRPQFKTSKEFFLELSVSLQT